MKQIIFVYALTSLFVLAILSVLSYEEGAGYIYVLWHGIQIQTNIWIVTFGLILIAFILQLLWVWVKRIRSREQRKIEQIADFSSLHTYEKLGVLWILKGEAKQQEYLETIFENSGLLKQVMQSRVLLKQKQTDDALAVLQKSSPDAFELAEIQRIEVLLAQNNPEQALTHLEFLHGHELSPWLGELKEIYLKRLNGLWGRFAEQYPWHYLKATYFGHIDQQAKQKWLLKLLSGFEQASVQEWELIQTRYSQLENDIYQSSYESRALWLKIISRIPEMAFEQSKLSLALLDEKFDQDIFYLWFQQQLLKQNPDYELTEKQIDHLELKYPCLPILSFSKWHLLIATGRESEADHLLSLYPNHPLMDYLRIKSALNGDADLMQQLNTVLESDNKFIQIKI
jgi:hypothetical protein